MSSVRNKLKLKKWLSTQHVLYSKHIEAEEMVEYTAYNTTKNKKTLTLALS
jgi:hypothetical protein